ncbi:hypothetical protein [Pedobacter sp. L105]|uniref:hypothetical protein n=1 Tax=Pedobacter sp. L105 TaxID=1641871 RepID=UPI00131DEFA5|nr:hypothetical protein [Pedobacter sp. L105]
MKLLAILFYLFLLPFIDGTHTEKSNAQSLLDGKMRLILPANLKRLSEAEIISESPRVSQRPTYVFKDKIKNIKFAINYGASKAEDKDLPSVKAFFEKRNNRPFSNIISSDLIIVNHKQYIIMKFELSERLSLHKVFNIWFITTVANKLFLADYSFPTEQRSIEEKRAEDILNSIEIKK